MLRLEAFMAKNEKQFQLAKSLKIFMLYMQSGIQDYRKLETFK